MSTGWTDRRLRDHYAGIVMDKLVIIDAIVGLQGDPGTYERMIVGIAQASFAIANEMMRERARFDAAAGEGGGQ